MVDGAARGSLVGRDVESAHLRSSLDAAEAGAGGTVVVGGEAGIGKTRLVDALVVEARARGVVVLSGACLESGSGSIPYAPFVEALRAFVRSVEPGRLPALLGPGRTELARLLPELAGPGPRSPLTEADLHGQARLFEAVLDAVERQARSGTVLIVVEDIQWTDEGTRDLLGFLSRSLRSSPALIVATIRSDDLDRRDPTRAFLGELERDDWVTRIELAPLTRDDIAAMLRGSLGKVTAPELIDHVASRTGGNPFYVEQLTATVAAGEDPERLSPRLRDVLVARLAVLPDPTQTVLRGASAAGRRVDDDLLVAVLKLPPATVADALRASIDQGILTDADADDDGRGGYAFRHALLAEVAYDELLIGERDRLHTAFGRELERRGEVGGMPVTAGEIAYHFDAARDIAQAVPALVDAGLEAEGVYAFADAMRLYGRALDLWSAFETRPIDERRAPRLDRVGVLQRAAESAVLAGSFRRAVELGQAAIEHAEMDPAIDASRRGSLHDRLRWYLWEAGERAAAVAAVEEALRLIPSEPPTAARARALAQAAGLHLFGGDPGSASMLADEAITAARAADAPAEEALALAVRGWLQALGGQVDDGIATYRAGLDIAVGLGGVEGIALGHANLAALLDRVGRTEASLAAAREGFEAVRRLGVPRTYGGLLLGHASKALFDLGRWDESAAAADEGLDLDPVGRSAVWLHINRARVDTNQGRFDDAAAHLERASAIDAGPAGVDLYGPALVAGRAELAAWRGDTSGVRAAVDAAVLHLHDDRPLDPALGWLAWHAIRAEADTAVTARARHDEAALEDCRQRVAPIAARLLDANAAVATTDARRAAIVGMCEGEMARLDDRRDPAPWEATGSAWDALGRPAPAAYARFRAGEAILAARSGRDDAGRMLRAAHQAAVRLGAAPLLDEITGLARHGRIDLSVQEDPLEPPSRGAPNDLGLTERETEVIRLVAAGWSNQQIADALFITRKTASVHVSNILAKLGAQNRVEAAAIAHRLGLDDGPEPLLP